MGKDHFSQLLESGDEHIQKLHQIVLDSVKEEKLIASKIYSGQEKLSFADRLSDKGTEFGGSWKFIWSFLSLMTVWIFSNVYWLSKQRI